MKICLVTWPTIKALKVNKLIGFHPTVKNFWKIFCQGQLKKLLKVGFKFCTFQKNIFVLQIETSKQCGLYKKTRMF